MSWWSTEERPYRHWATRVLIRAMASSAAFSGDHLSSMARSRALPQTFSAYTCELAGLFEWSKIFVFRSRKILVTMDTWGSFSPALPTCPREKKATPHKSLNAVNQRPLAALTYSAKRLGWTTNLTKALASSGF